MAAPIVGRITVEIPPGVVGVRGAMSITSIRPGNTVTKFQSVITAMVSIPSGPGYIELTLI